MSEPKPPAIPDKRTRARILALQALCAFDAQGEAFAEHLGAFLHDSINYADLGWRGRCEPDIVAHARRLAEGAWQRRPESDALLQKHVADWSVERMQPVDRNILRLGLYELLDHPETPPAVVINEAVELANIFGGSDSPGFVNGVLDALRKRLEDAAARG